jgi:hypothetical protein
MTPTTEAQSSELSYNDFLGKALDVNSTAGMWGDEYGEFGGEFGGGDDEELFKLVDSYKSKRSMNRRRKASRHANNRHNNNNRERSNRAMVEVDKLLSGKMRKHVHQQQRGKRGKQRSKNRRNMYRRGRRFRSDRQASVVIGGDWELREEIDLSYLSRMTISADNRTKLSKKSEVDVETTDVQWVGTLDQIDERLERINLRSTRPLRKEESSVFANITTTDDAILMSKAVEVLEEEEGKEGNMSVHVFCTDDILAHLMTCSRSVEGWDLSLSVKTLENGSTVIFVDWREDSFFPLLSVSETATTPLPPKDEIEEFNTMENLRQEATTVNQHFTQQMLREPYMIDPATFSSGGSQGGLNALNAAFGRQNSQGRGRRGQGGGKQQEEEKGEQVPSRTSFGEHPFFEDHLAELKEEFDQLPQNNNVEFNRKPASSCYRYRDFRMEMQDTGASIPLIFHTRCEVNGWVPKKNSSSVSEKSLCTVQAINEWDPKYCNGNEWRRNLDRNLGSVLIQEMSNNSFKFAKWAVRAILAGCDFIKLGFVSRTPSPANFENHEILGVKSYEPKKFAKQQNLSLDNCWGILRYFIRVIVTKAEEGTFTLMRDHSRQQVLLYKMPEEEEDSEDELSDVEEEEGEEEEKEN